MMFTERTLRNRARPRGKSQPLATGPSEMDRNPAHWNNSTSNAFITAQIPPSIREYLHEHDIDIDLSCSTFEYLSTLYNFQGAFIDFLLWSYTFLIKVDESDIQFEGLRSNQTELLPAASFRVGGGLNIQIQTGCRIMDASPDPIRHFDGLHIVKTDNSNMNEEQLETFRREINQSSSSLKLLQHFHSLNLHFVICSTGNSWDDRLCYNFEFSVLPGRLTKYTKSERLELCKRSGAVLDEPGEVPGLEKPIVGDLCGALLGLWVSQNSVAIGRDGNVEANLVIKQFIKGIDNARLSDRLGPVSWWHVSRGLAHATAATRCAYSLAIGRSVAAASNASYAESSILKSGTKNYIWNWKGALSISCEIVINIIAVVVVVVMGKSSGFKIEWLAIMVSLVAHLSTWVGLAINRADMLRIRSWADAKGRIPRINVIERIVTGELMATDGDGGWTMCEDGFDVTGLNPTVKELQEAGAEFFGLTDTCSTLLFKHRAGVISKETEMSNTCYVKPTLTPLRTIQVSRIGERTIVERAPG